MTRLEEETEVLELARTLGLSTRGRVLGRIRGYALDFVAQVHATLPAATSLYDLRSLLCDRLSVCLRFIREDEDFSRLAIEFGFSEAERRNLVYEFDHQQVEGWLVANPKVAKGLRRWVAIVDARGERSVRAYFSAWHEIAHMIVTPHQLELGLRRSIPVDKTKDRVETVVDMVAGDLAFYAPLVSPVLSEEVAGQGGRLTMDAIESTRLRVAPEASFQAAAIAATRLIEHPVLFIQMERQYKRSEAIALRSGQAELALPGAELWVVPKLRVTMAIPAEKHGSGLAIFRSMRVPPASVLTRAWESGADVTLRADENQEWWETSQSGPLPPQRVRVEAMRRGSYVYGILTPT